MFPNLISYKKFPFIRLLTFLIAGILTEWYLQINLSVLIEAAILPCFLLLTYIFIPLSLKFTLRWLQGISILLLVATTGSIIIYTSNITKQPEWYGNVYVSKNSILVTIEEPLVNKANSYKALASVNAVSKDGNWQATKGNILIYFKKDSSPPAIKYDSQLIIQKPLQNISNSGNPGCI